MITPPQSTPSFYTAVFNGIAAMEIIRSVSPVYAKDIKQILVTSLDMPSDVHAINECQTSVDRIASLIGIDRSSIKFNPMYLPAPNIDLADSLEVDNEGDIVKVDGFGNPFVSATISCSSDENLDLIEANVCYKPFEMPPVTEMLQQKKVLLT